MGVIPSGDITGASVYSAHKHEHRIVYFPLAEVLEDSGGEAARRSRRS